MIYINQIKNYISNYNNGKYCTCRPNNGSIKEFSFKSQTSFGIDTKDKTRVSDFENVSGGFSNHPVVREIMEHID